MLDESQILFYAFHGSTNLIHSYIVNNFRCLKINSPIDIKPFTFLFGPNGSGKSSIIASLNLFKQILETESFKKNLITSDFGLYKDFITDNNVNDSISFEFIFQKTSSIHLGNKPILQHNFYKDPATLYVKFNFRKAKTINNLMLLYSWEFKDQDSGFEFFFESCRDARKKCKFKITKSNKIQPYINQLEDDDKRLIYTFQNLSDNELEIMSKVFSIYYEYVENEMDIFAISDQPQEDEIGWPSEQKMNNDKEKIIEKVQSFDQKVNEKVLFEENDHWLNIENAYYWIELLILPYYALIKDYLKQAFESTDHIRNIRNEFPRNFSRADKRNSFLDNELYNDLFEVYENPLNNKKHLLNILVKDLNLGDSIEITGENTYELFLLKGKARINYMDTSSGFKEIFPIILKLLKSDPGNLILIEQPELHLHPKLQTDFINVLHKYREQRRFLIETHSEHMVRKIQVMIAKGILNKNEVAVYYFDNKSGYTSIKKMLIGDNGFFLEPWPDGFFDESYNLTKDLIFAKNN